MQRQLTMFAICLVLTAALAQHALAATTVVSTASLPLTGSFSDSITCETVSLSGTLLLTTQVTFSSSATIVELQAVLPQNLVATGETSGLNDSANGVVRLTIKFPPESTRWRKASETVVAEIYPDHPTSPGRDGADAMFLTVNFVFDNNGNLLQGDGGSTVTVLGDGSSCLF